MQNQYAGDIGDFSKFGLIRSLYGDENPRIYTLWMHYDYLDNSKDGEKRTYLNDADSWAVKCDPELVNLFKDNGFIKKQEEGIKILERIKGLMPGKLDYYDKDFALADKHHSERPVIRKQLIKEALAGSEKFKSNLVVFDPDNGIDVPGVSSKARLKSGKYIYRDELKLFYNAGFDLLIYQHQDRSSSEKRHVTWSLFAKENKIKYIWEFTFHRESSRHFMLLVHENSAGVWEQRIEKFSHTPWCTLKEKSKKQPFTWRKITL